MGTKKGSYTILIILFLLSAVKLFSHGTEYEILQSGIIVIRVSHDTGEVLSDCEVLIFAPEETTPGLKTVTDDMGVFYFFPDRSGKWIIQVRGADGHGVRINLDVNDSMTITDGQNTGSAIPLMQKIIIAVCVLWGFIGTYLFFKRRIKK